MKYPNTLIALGKAGKELRRRMRQSLSQRGKNATNNLANSIRYEQYVDTRYGPRLVMSADTYAIFVDQGVTGTGRDLKEGERVAQSRSTYAFRRSSKSIPPDVVLGWMNAKGVRSRSKKTGRFIKENRKSSAFLIARAIHRRGLEPTGFIEDTIDRYQPTVTQEVGLALAKDGAEFLQERINVLFQK